MLTKEVDIIRKILKSLLSFIIGLIILIAAYIGLNEAMAAYVHYNLDKTYFTTNVGYIYVADRENEQAVIKAVENVLNKVPNRFAKEFKTNWKIIVSPTPPKEISQTATIPVDSASGFNLTTGKTVWISSNMDGRYEDIFAHEFGHFIAYELGGEDYSSEFYELYTKYKDSYIQHGNNKVDIYNASTANEFYAMLCQEYICYPDYLKEHFKEGYDYIAKNLKENPYTFFLSGYFNELFSVFLATKTQIQNVFSF